MKDCKDCGGSLNGWGPRYCKNCYLKRHPEETPEEPIIWKDKVSEAVNDFEKRMYENRNSTKNITAFICMDFVKKLRNMGL